MLHHLIVILWIHLQKWMTGLEKEELSVLTEATSRVCLLGITKWKARGRTTAASQMFSFLSWIFCLRNWNVSVAPAAQTALRNQCLPGRGGQLPPLPSAPLVGNPGWQQYSYLYGGSLANCSHKELIWSRVTRRNSWTICKNLAEDSLVSPSSLFLTNCRRVSVNCRKKTT